MPLPRSHQGVRPAPSLPVPILIRAPRSTRLLAKLAAITLGAFLLLFAPWLPPFAPARAVLDPLTRIFPLARGLFEDKVANFWCASDVALKWRRRLGEGALVRLSALGTAGAFAPAVVGLLRAGWVLRVWPAPTKDGKDAKEAVGEEGEEAQPPMLQLLPYALLTSALAFFLLSFQVHEKTILLPLLPLTLLLSGAAPGSAVWEWGMLVNNVACFRCVSDCAVRSMVADAFFFLFCVTVCGRC
jgi:alpha-1,3-glucosyltransferase